MKNSTKKVNNFRCYIIYEQWSKIGKVQFNVLNFYFNENVNIKENIMRLFDVDCQM